MRSLVIIIIFSLLTTSCGPHLGSVQSIESYTNVSPMFSSEAGSHRIMDGAARLGTGMVGDPVMATVELFGGSLFCWTIVFGETKGVEYLGAGIIRPFRSVGYTTVGTLELLWGVVEYPFVAATSGNAK